MERVEKRIDRGVDDDCFGDVYSAYRLLVDDAYLAEKGVIMAAIERFIDLVDQRTLSDVEEVRAANQRLFVGPIAILGSIVLSWTSASPTAMSPTRPAAS